MSEWIGNTRQRIWMKPTAEQRRHMGRVAELGCIVCRHWFGLFSPAQVHHIRAGNGLAQRDHDRVIPLCYQHHQSGVHGVAIHAGRLEWESRWGTEEELLERVNRLLESDLGPPQSPTIDDQGEGRG